MVNRLTCDIDIVACGELFITLSILKLCLFRWSISCVVNVDRSKTMFSRIEQFTWCRINVAYNKTKRKCHMELQEAYDNEELSYQIVHIRLFWCMTMHDNDRLLRVNYWLITSKDWSDLSIWSPALPWFEPLPYNVQSILGGDVWNRMILTYSPNLWEDNSFLPEMPVWR